MELFHRRYLCLFSFLFVLVSALCTALTYTAKHALLILLLILVIISAVLISLIKKKRFVQAVILTSAIFSLIAVFNSFLFISVDQREAMAYISDQREAELTVLSCEYSDEERSEYTVRIDRIGEEQTDIKAYLYCGLPSSLDYGDKIVSSFKISPSSKYVNTRGDIPLTLSVAENAPVLYKEPQSVNYFTFDGIMRICAHIREAFGNYVDGIFKDSSGIVKGFLIDDRSDIPLHVQNDFKRSGTTHLLAVSGMHIVVLLGSLEILLRKIYVPKKVRCTVISFAALMLLVLTDFSGSAVRSVLMLYCVYVSYLFYEDHDTVTALFFSVFLIILLSPHSVYDIGMWMSFLATLGLVTVYAYFDKKLPRVKAKKGIKRLLQRLLLGTLRAILITLCANFFLILIMWIFFGEISLSTFGANLLLSPIVSIFMPFCAVGVLVGWIPYLNYALVFIAERFEYVILMLVDFFANLKGAVLSLQYPFVPYLVIAFSLAMAVLLVIRLRQKLWIALPPFSFVAAFCACLIVFNLMTPPVLRYERSQNGEMLFYDNVDQSYVCDLGKGGYEGVGLFLESGNPYATEVEGYVLIKPSRAHLYSLERIFTNVHVRVLYLPRPNGKDETLLLGEILILSQSYGTEVRLYGRGGGIALFEDLITQ